MKLKPHCSFEVAEVISVSALKMSILSHNVVIKKQNRLHGLISMKSLDG